MKVRIGLIGAGGISGAHVTALNQVDDADIVAVCDIDKKKAQTRAADAKAKGIFTDFRKMLDDTDLDAVWLCTPPIVRTDPIEACIEKNIPVFTEKPASDDLPTAQALAEKIEQSGLPVMVGYVLRYMTATDRLREAMANDLISLACSVYCSPMTLRYRNGEDVAKWFFKKEISGGALVDQATHLFDMMRYLIGEVDALTAMGSNCVQEKTDEYTVEDAYGIGFRFANGVMGVHGHTWGHHAWRSNLTIYGANASYFLDCMKNQCTIEDKGGQITTYAPGDSAMLNEDRAFVEMVKGGDFSAIRSTYADAVKTLAWTRKCLDVLNKADTPLP